MKFFLDTSVLVAALVRRHPQHVRGFSVFRSVVEGEHEGYISTHTLAEFYAVITRLPVRPAVQSSEAMLMIKRDILARLGGHGISSVIQPVYSLARYIALRS